ncbi:MAG: alkaline phosphatase family protein, partial [Paludibaculum sp.]
RLIGKHDKCNSTWTNAVFGEDVTPNHHKLAREYALLDNFYVTGDTAAAGLSWSTAALAPPFLQLLGPGADAGRRTLDALAGGERAAQPPAGYLWSNALQRHISVRNYGMLVTNIEPAPANGAQVSALKEPSLNSVTNRAFRGPDPAYRDTERVKVFLKDLAEAETTGNLPQLTLIRLNNDRTAGTASKLPTPKAAVADNDAALGQLVAAVSRSRFWPSTVIFVVETSTQGGPDHIDAHRAPAFVISPYTRNRGTEFDDVQLHVRAALH